MVFVGSKLVSKGVETIGMPLVIRCSSNEK